MRPIKPTTLRGLLAAAVLIASVVSGACSRDSGEGARKPGNAGGRVTVSGDDRIAGALTWDVPTVQIAPDGRKAALSKASAAIAAGQLYEDGNAAIPIYLALLRVKPDDADAQSGLQRALDALLADGKLALVASGEEMDALRHAHAVAAVVRTVAPTKTDVLAYLHAVDRADQLWDLNRAAEQDLRAGRLGESGRAGALQKLRTALRLQPGQSRAMQGLGAVESALIRRGEDAAARGNFASAARWISIAATVRHGTATIADARARIAVMRHTRVARLHDEATRALMQVEGLPVARGKLAEMLRIAEPGNGDVAELRQQIEQAMYYGLFRPGQHFTDALTLGARGPEMVILSHGGFRMGATDADTDAGDMEKPAHYVHFSRGFAMAMTEVTVDQYRDFVRASGYRSTATRRDQAVIYDERSGNFMHQDGVDWRSAYDGHPAAGNLPVIFISRRDAQAYVDWLSAQSGQHYHLPSEAQFEYALRAGSNFRYPWGNGAPPPGAGNLTGRRDSSPGGHRWSNGFAGFGDGYWGPAPVGRFLANAYGLHDMAGNVSEWVADCWHDSYRRAPDDGAAWVNPGCRSSVVRGGSWASSPAEARSTWRAPQDEQATNARVGFRVVRDI